MHYRNLLLLFSFCVVLLLFLPGAALADTIFKTDGTQLKGKITKENEDYVWIETRFGVMKVDRLDVDYIERGGNEEAEKPKVEEEKPVKPEKPVEKETIKPVKPEEPEKPDKAKKPEEPEDKPALFDDKLMSETNLKKLQKICQDRMKAYEGVSWDQAYNLTVEGGGRTIFNIKCNSTKKVAEHYKWLLSKLYSKYCKVFAAFRPSAIPCNIEIYRNYTEFRQVKGVQPGVGGFYQPGRHVLCAFHGTMGSLDTKGVLAHEGCHLFQDLIGLFGRGRGGGGCPIWVLEGMAVLMEAAKVERDGEIHIKGVSPDRLQNLQNKIKSGTAIPLATVMSTPQPQFRADHYAHAGMFTFWLIKGSKKKSTVALYNDYLKIAAGGVTSSGATLRPGRINSGDFERLCQARGTTLDKLEEQWKKWVMKQKIERPGRVEGNNFVCDEYGLIVSRPDSKWKFETKETHGALCMMTHKDIKGWILVSLGGTFGTPKLDEYLAMGDTMRKNYISRFDRYKQISRETKKFFKDSLDGYESVSEYADKESPLTKEFMRRRGISVSMVDTLYHISCMAPPEGFDEYQKYFDKVVASFRLDADKIE